MMTLVLGAVALLVAIVALRYLAGADPKALAKAVRWIGVGVLLLAAVGLAAVDRVGLAALAASTACAVLMGGRVWPLNWRFPYRSQPGKGAQNSTTSRVKTEWLEMTLEHASGIMTGRVLRGDLAGNLDDLDLSSLIRLFGELGVRDSQSARLLESYLDRRFGSDWRTSSEFTSRSDKMTRGEAYAVLGLSPGASKDEIHAAHHRLILQNHPDHGGSSYLAAKINQARDMLLGD